MDNATVIVVAIFAVIIIVVVFRYRKQINVLLKAPFGMELDVKASNEPERREGGVQAERIKAGRNVDLKDKTGQGAILKDVEAGQDVRATVSRGDNPPKKE